MNAELNPTEFDGKAPAAGVRIDAFQLQINTTRSVSYRVLHTGRPVFDPDEATLRDTLSGREAFLVVDRNVDRLYGASIRAYARQHLALAGYLVIDGDEANKNWAQAELICNTALSAGLGRTGVIVGIGGGVVLDTCGFAASIYRRGIGYIRIPTTLIGQVDVSVGIKQGINAGGRKNVVGTFYPPIASINDVSLLRSLSRDHVAAGFAEIIKMAMIADRELFELVESHGAPLLASAFQRPLAPAQAIMQRAEMGMLRELQDNLFETELKRPVDFGHTFSIAIEIDSRFEIAHGLAVGLDILISTGIAVDRSLCDKACLRRLLAVYQIVGLPRSQRMCDAERLHQSLASVRTHRGGALNLVVPLDIGRTTFVQDVTRAELERSLDLLIEAERADGRTRL